MCQPFLVEISSLDIALLFFGIGAFEIPKEFISEFGGGALPEPWYHVTFNPSVGLGLRSRFLLR